MNRMDAYTMANEPILSIDLMERAALACTHWIERNLSNQNTIIAFCGPGNNGGDGLAIVRILLQKGWNASAILLKSKDSISPDCKTNLDRLANSFPDRINIITKANQLPRLNGYPIIIDAIFGTGFKGVTQGLEADAIAQINQSGAEVISIDTPSGLCSNKTSFINDNKIVIPKNTLTFQFLKPALIVPENMPKTGKVHVLDIGLMESGLNTDDKKSELVDLLLLNKFIKNRALEGHKGMFGHAVLMAGGPGKAGAGLLSGNACLRSGCGLLSMVVPHGENSIFQTGLPMAMTIQYNEHSTPLCIPDKTTAVAIGPGIGTSSDTQSIVSNLLNMWRKPAILDADAINLISQNPMLKALVPAGSLLTPHVGEFDRLVGASNNDFDRWEKQINLSKETGWYILLKGAFSKITTPEGHTYVNPTGNSGMAKGGSGDVLTGLLVGLNARGYSIEESAILGAYLHGLSGDLAALDLGQEAMHAGDLVDYIPKAWNSLLSESV
ncbi:MAG: NAD(P)H-hydrate dehydratase [Bacteroidota bacterium]